MSFAVRRGSPTAAQRYVDAVLEEAARALARDARLVSMPQLLLHCMRAHPDRVFMTNGATGAKITCRQLLELAVPLARALAAAGLRGRRVMLAARDHERTVAVYLALNFAGVVPFMTDPISTKHELRYFMELIEPCIIFCDAATHDTVLSVTATDANDTNGTSGEIGVNGTNANITNGVNGNNSINSTSYSNGVNGTNGVTHDKPLVFAIHTDQLFEYAKGHEKDLDNYRVENSEPETTLLMLPTSGSTGMPKAARYNNRGQIDQLASTWMHFSQFPRPTERAMLLTTPQWATFTMMLTTSCIFEVELLMSPEMPTVDHVLHMMEKYKPTWTFFGPPFAKQLTKAAEKRHFASLETVITLGSKATPELLTALKEKMPPGSHVCDGYGMTEAHGFVAATDPGAPVGCNGPVTNILDYKLVKEDGKEAGVGESGELYIKGDCIISGYHKNESELAASMADGWLRTGDEFSRDERGRVYYRRRIKFSFKFNNQLVSPEELEALISNVPFVGECVVCDSERGPAAAATLRADAPPEPAARDHIHQLVASTLSDHKRLRGGVAFVAALPRTHTGKLNRAQCRDLVQKLIRDGTCC